MIQMKMPKHKCGLYLEHDPHKDCYEDLAQHLVDRGLEKEEFFQECVDADSAWILQWYPETPIGFHILIGPTLESVLGRANDTENEEDL